MKLWLNILRVLHADLPKLDEIFTKFLHWAENLAKK